MSIPLASEMLALDYPQTHAEILAVGLLAQHLRWMHRAFYLDPQTAVLDRSGIFKERRSELSLALNDIDMAILVRYVREHGFVVSDTLDIMMPSIVPPQKSRDTFPCPIEFTIPLEPFPVPEEQAIIDHLRNKITACKRELFLKTTICLCMVPEQGLIRQVYIDYLQKNEYYCFHTDERSCHIGRLRLSAYPPIIEASNIDVMPPPPYTSGKPNIECTLF